MPIQSSSSPPQSQRELLETVQRLWRSGHQGQAREMLRTATVVPGASRQIQLAAWAYDAAFQAPLQGRRVTLRRRGPGDLHVIREAWADKHFMSRFHRLAPPLPANDEALKNVLAREAAATPVDSKHLHWTIANRADQAGVGMMSLVEISLAHGHAEFIIGVRHASPGTALEASLLALEFAFGPLGMRKILSSIYGGNDYALRSTIHLGFQHEGTLRQHIRDQATGEMVDLRLSALFRRDFFSVGNQRLAQRLLGRSLRA